MSAFALKIIAMVTMFIDHLFASCIDPYGVDVWNISRHIVPGTGTTLYWISRMIGRIAFPIFCFQIVEGVRYTKNWKRYMARLALLALISEIPFDLALKNFQIDMSSQNVFLTLLFGMMIVTFMKVVDQDWKYLVWPVLVFGYGYMAKFIFHTDYDWSGVVCIAVMGLMNEPWEKVFRPYTPAVSQMIHVVFAALGIFVLYYKNSFEIYGFFALLPIALYNGRKGYSSKKVQYAFYFFYPVHLIVLFVIAYTFR